MISYFGAAISVEKSTHYVWVTHANPKQDSPTFEELKLYASRPDLPTIRTRFLDWENTRDVARIYVYGCISFGRCRHSLQSDSLWCTTSLMIHAIGLPSSRSWSCFMPWDAFGLCQAPRCNVFKGSDPTLGHWRSRVLAALANNHGLIIEQIVTSISFVWPGNYDPEEVQKKLRLP
ncbi:hypothetical protein VNO77_23448 [Canavalia gladiata]|uniref:Uncharacterized protein n=1 Tax=Canavalia gladiata TaxID=3824 RepID=A0AAN9L7T7_CANGL